MIESVAYLALHTSPLLQPGTGTAGGMNVYIDELATTMAKRGIDVVVFTRRTDPQQPDEIVVRDAYRVVHIDAGPIAPTPIEDLPRFVAGFGEAVIAWAKSRSHHFDLVHSHYWLSGWAGVLVKEGLGIPLANSFHTLGRIKDRSRRMDEDPSSALRLGTEEHVISLSDCIIAATPYEFDDLIEHYGASPERLCVTPPGIDHEIFSPGDRIESRRSLGLDSAPTVLFVGRIQAHKGTDLAVRSLALMPDTGGARNEPPVLIIVGGPSGRAGEAELSGLHRLAAELGVADRVHFIAPQPHDQLARFYRAADVLVMPSRSESFGLVAAEAQACGLPVVASRVGGLRYIIAESESGVLVDDLDPRSFAAALSAVLDHPAFAKRLSQGAIDFARRFSWSVAADRFLELYEGIIG
jgi:D-inositol-3-phosphate glycosyltransferase